MANLVQPETKFMNQSISLLNQLLTIKTQLEQVNSAWAGTPAYQTAINQAALDGSQFAGMNATNLADAEYVLAQVLNALNANIPAVAVIALWG